MSDFNTLKTVGLGTVEIIHRPLTEDAEINLDSSAREVFTDFTLEQPFMLEESTKVDQTIEMMQREHVRRKLVIDSNEHLRGVVSLADLMSSKVIKALEVTGLKREDLTIASVMVHKDTLQAVELKEFEHARIGDLLMTMKQFGEEHLLVVDGASNELCGIVSTTDIARKLHQAVTIDERATTFSEIYASFAHK